VDTKGAGAAWQYYFVQGRRRRLYIKQSIVAASDRIAATLLVQQAIGTVWFWTANIHDQLYAHGSGENTATWLGGGCGFLALVAFMQYRVARLQPTARNKAAFVIQVASALGSVTALTIFVVRRFAWTTADTWCVVGIGITAIGVLLWFVLRRGRSNQPTSLRYFFMAGWVMVLLAVELRSLPRLFQSASLFINNPMSLATVLSGCYIALIRLLAVGVTHFHSPSLYAKHAWQAELYGNFGSQLILTIGWCLASFIS
jgi:hypothetical protein